MATHHLGAAKRLILSLAAGAALSGCVAYGPPYSAYDYAPAAAYSPYYYSYRPYYGGPYYAGPPVSLSFGFHEHSYRGGHGWRGGHGGYRGGGGRHGGGHRH